MPGPDLTPSVRSSRRPAFRLGSGFWNSKPVPRPVIPADLEQLSWPERSADVMRHTLLGIEYWLSQGGWLREWLRLSLWTGAVLIVLSLIVVPAVTAILGGIRDWTGLLGATVGWHHQRGRRHAPAHRPGSRHRIHGGEADPKASGKPPAGIQFLRGSQKELVPAAAGAGLFFSYQRMAMCTDQFPMPQRF